MAAVIGDSGDAAREAGAAVQANTLSKKSKECYSGCIKALKVWAHSIEEFEGDAEIFDDSGELVLPMSVKMIEMYFGHLAAQRVPWNGTHRHLSVSKIGGVTSAITWQHKTSRIKVNDEVSMYMSQFTKGYKRTIAEKKQSNEYPMMEGKEYLSTNGLKILIEEALKLGQPDDVEDVDTGRIAAAAVGGGGAGNGIGGAGPGDEPGGGGEGDKGTWSQAIFFLPYLLLLWNTLARVASVGVIMLSHFSLQNGVLCCKVPRCKSDQDGEHAFEKHIFANPIKPMYCAVLALGMRVWTMRHQDGGRLFPGATPERKFCDVLSSILGRINHARRLVLQNLGAHSIKKGAITFLNSILGGPSAIAIELRADHHIGDVRSRYIFQSVSQDMYIGRCLAMLPTHDIDFCCSAAYFTSDCPEIDWDAVFPMHADVPDTFRPVLPVLLAQLVHHRAWLRTTLKTGHPVLMTHLFSSGVVDELAPYVRFDRDPQGGGIPSV
jgi:hypothetical protein